jgi:hypothetical protein
MGSTSNDVNHTYGSSADLFGLSIPKTTVAAIQEELEAMMHRDHLYPAVHLEAKCCTYQRQPSLNSAHSRNRRLGS